MGEPESGQIEAIWTIDQGKNWSKGEMAGAIYDVPRDFLWSPHSEQMFIYLADAAALGGAWRVDLETEKVEPLGETLSLGATGLHLLAWASEGIVIQNQDEVWLLDENGEIRGEIHFREGEDRALAPLQVSSTVVDWDVPYVHQIYDTPAWFHGGWACGPTSVVMALAYYGRLSGDYGWYVPNEYMHQSACSGEHTFDRVQDDAADPPHEAWGAYGTCTNNGYAVAWRMYEYAEKHDVGHYYEGSPTEGTVKGELDGGAVVILGTDLTGSGHIVAARGYTDASPTRYIVNDPAGDWHAGYYNANGNGVQYTWAEMSPNWYVALYGPEYLPYLYENSTWDDVLTIQNGDKPSPGWMARVKVCFMNTNGSLNTSRDNDSSRIPVNGIWSLPLSGVFSSFNGSAVVMRYQTGVSVAAEMKSGTGINLKAAGYSGLPSVHTNAYLPTVGARTDEWSEVAVMNTEGQAASVTIRFFDRNGNEMTNAQQTISLNPNGRSLTDLLVLRSQNKLPADFLGAAYVSANRRIVAEATTHFASSPVFDSDAYEGAGAGSTGYLYFPQVKRRQFGGSWYDYSGIVVQNLDPSNSAGVYVYFYDRSGVLKLTLYDSIPRNSAHGYNTRYGGNFPPETFNVLGTDFNGSVKVYSAHGRPIIGVSKTWMEGGVNATEMYVGEAGGATTLVAPLVYRRTYSGQWADPQDDTAWLAYTGIIVHNLGGSDASVTVYIYDQNGVEKAHFSDTIPANSPHGYNTRYCNSQTQLCGQAPKWAIDALPYNSIGSMRIESTGNPPQPLIGVVDMGWETQAIYYYNAVQR
jgi:hypothetical protein